MEVVTGDRISAGLAVYAVNQATQNQRAESRVLDEQNRTRVSYGQTGRLVDVWT